MRFWDASALLLLLIEESASEEVMGFLTSDPEIAIWWGTEIELISALCRLEREQKCSRREVAAIEKEITALTSEELIIPAREEIKRFSRRLLMNHPLRAADAQQLAAALFLAGDHLHSLDFVTLDNRLAEAALREGFIVLP